MADRRRRLRAAVAGVAIAALALAGCSSSDAPSKADLGRQRLERRNRTYLVSIGWKQTQASCVARRIHVDLTVLLDGAHDDDPTSKAGFTAFAKAAQMCIRAVEHTTTTG
jgi:hypothetical protein